MKQQKQQKQNGRGLLSCFSSTERARYKEAANKQANRFRNAFTSHYQNNNRSIYMDLFQRVRDPSAEADFRMAVMTYYGGLRVAWDTYELYYSEYTECGGKNVGLQTEYNELKDMHDTLEAEEAALLSKRWKSNASSNSTTGGARKKPSRKTAVVKKGK